MKTNDHSLPPKLLDLLLDAICVVDVRGYFVFVSGACERIFAYAPTEMVGKPMIDFVLDEDRARTQEAAQAIVAGKPLLHFENRYVRKDGQIAHIMWSARWSETDQVRVAVARDVTAHKHAELRSAAAADPGPAPSCWRLSDSPPCLIPPGFAPIPLSGQDYTVMRALATTGEAVSRATIVAALGKDFVDYDQRRLDTQIRRLRRKVEQACGLKLPLTTMRGLGYRFYDKIDVGRQFSFPAACA